MVELLMTPSEVARLLKMTPENVRQLERKGKLQAAFKTGGGGRLFRPDDVATFKVERERQAREKAGQKRAAAKARARKASVR